MVLRSNLVQLGEIILIAIICLAVLTLLIIKLCEISDKRQREKQMRNQAPVEPSKKVIVKFVSKKSQKKGKKR